MPGTGPRPGAVRPGEAGALSARLPDPVCSLASHAILVPKQMPTEQHATIAPPMHRGSITEAQTHSHMQQTQDCILECHAHQ